MTNYEFYKKELEEIKSRKINERANIWCDFVKEEVLKDNCDAIPECGVCSGVFAVWLLEEHEEPETDWSKVRVDTPIFVRSSKEDKWRKRHFAKFENGKVYAYDKGLTSWTGSRDTICWKYAKLAEEAQRWTKQK